MTAEERVKQVHPDAFAWFDENDGTCFISLPHLGEASFDDPDVDESVIENAAWENAAKYLAAPTPEKPQ